MKNEITAIQNLIDNYFEGIYYGKIDKLESVFHEKSLLFGDIKGQPYLKSVAEYLKSVGNRESPHQKGEKFEMKTISIEKRNHIAFLKLQVPMLGYNYYDYISLIKNDDQWQIGNKLFTHVDK